MSRHREFWCPLSKHGSEHVGRCRVIRYTFPHKDAKDSLQWNRTINFYVETIIPHQGDFIGSLLYVNIDCTWRTVNLFIKSPPSNDFLHTRVNSVDWVFSIFLCILVAFITASLIGYKKVLNNDKSDHFHSLKIMNSKISRNSFDKCGIEFQINENAKNFRD